GADGLLDFRGLLLRGLRRLADDAVVRDPLQFPFAHRRADEARVLRADGGDADVAVLVDDLSSGLPDRAPGPARMHVLPVEHDVLRLLALRVRRAGSR